MANILYGPNGIDRSGTGPIEIGPIEIGLIATGMIAVWTARGTGGMAMIAAAEKAKCFSRKRFANFAFKN
jgi:hypothetical protein